jgi:hypothetical protein
MVRLHRKKFMEEENAQVVCSFGGGGVHLSASGGAGKAQRK